MRGTPTKQSISIQHFQKPMHKK